MKISNYLKFLFRATLTFVLVIIFSGINLWSSLPQVKAETPGKDGSLTVAAANTILNRYAALSSSASAGGSSITVTDIANLYPNGIASAPGDLLLIYQAQGATIDLTSNTSSYGTVTAYNSAGLYEFVTVSSVSGNTITVAPPCTGGLKNNYASSGRTQVICVPQYTSLTINPGASIVAQTWNGQTGGIVAIHVQSTTTLNGSVDASGRGFRGGCIR